MIFKSYLNIKLFSFSYLLNLHGRYLITGWTDYIARTFSLNNEALEAHICSGPREARLFSATHKVLIMSHVAKVGHIVVRRERHGTGFGEYLEPGGKELPSIELIVIVGTVGLGALLSVLAGVQLIVVWMILLLFPAMALGTTVLIWTPILIVIDELSATPVRALVLGVQVELILPSIILPIVSKDTLISLVVILIIRTPNCLEMEHVEV